MLKYKSEKDPVYVDILKDTLSCIQILNNKSIEEYQEFIEKIEAIKKSINEVKSQKLMSDMESFIFRILDDTPEELQELLGFLYDITKEKWFIAWHLDAVLLQQLKNHGNYYLILQLREQQDCLNFLLNRKSNSIDEWNMNQYMQTEMWKLLEMNYNKVPVCKRDQDFIVIATTHLLGINHAPTRLLLEFSRIIEVYLKKRVLIVCTLESVQLDHLKELGLQPLGNSKYLDIKGFFKLEYKECEFECCQLFLEESTRKEQQQLMDIIYQRKPLCVWQFAGIPAYASAMKQFTSYYYMQMTQGYSSVPADLVINYFEDSSKSHPEELKTLQEHGVPVTDMFFSLSRPSSKGMLKRNMFHIPEYGFCLGVAGNRLQEECTDEFVQILSDVLAKEKDIQLVFIGAVHQRFIEYIRKNTNAEDRCFFLGYQKDPEEALSLIDLYVDLPHQGGGYMGISALLEGKPVLCLKGGDVSAKAGDEFSYSSLQEYKCEIIRYKNDTQYYMTKSEAARNRSESVMVSDKQLAELIDKTIKTGVKE